MVPPWSCQKHDLDRSGEPVQYRAELIAICSSLHLFLIDPRLLGEVTQSGLLPL
eukprot:SAG22_NODE_161_length_16908_cov_39.687965_14_plen_54_part_00